MFCIVQFQRGLLLQFARREIVVRRRPLSIIPSASRPVRQECGRLTATHKVELYQPIQTSMFNIEPSERRELESLSHYARLAVLEDLLESRAIAEFPEFA